MDADALAFLEASASFLAPALAIAESSQHPAVVTTTVATARQRLWPAVAHVAARRGYRPEVSARLGRELFIHRAVLDGDLVKGLAAAGAAATTRTATRWATTR